MFKRKLIFPVESKESFFLWGIRQTGKTTLLKDIYPNASMRIDLLKTDVYRRYLDHPEYLRQELEEIPRPSNEVMIVVIDEIQKVPGLLDEVHWLIENKGIKFVLVGSSIRKLRQEHANLLGGRALRYELFGLVSQEISDDFNLSHLIRLLNNGFLPKLYLSDSPQRLWNAYTGNYIKDEIASEALVRNLPIFSGFLNIASLSDTEIVNFSTIARDCGVSSHTISGYFDILVDTLIGRWLPSYTKRPKRKVIQAPKFYFTDVGLVNFLAKRRSIEPGSELFGKAFENWVFHELTAYNSYNERFMDLAYWRLASGIEVDFLIDNEKVAIEAKATKTVISDHLKGLRNLIEDHPHFQSRIVVSLETKARKTEDGILILPVAEFATRLWGHKLF